MRVSVQTTSAEELRTARINIAAATACLPVTAEMAWTVPQLLKRVQLVSSGIRSTTGVLRCVIRMPEQDEQFAKAFADSGFLSCDQVIGRERWKYDLDEMAAKYSGASASQVLEHCRSLLARHRANEPFDWHDVLAGLQTLRSWLPELRTIELLERLYIRLHALHIESVHVAQCWTDRPTRTACAFHAMRHA
jgi:hypothetical protein